MSPLENCPICRAGRIETSFEIPGLLVLRCASCGHGLARQSPPSGPDVDYHAQYDSGAFLDALRETRERQAAVVIEAVRRQIPRPGHLLDFGAGRGWFLEACRRDEIFPLAGVDTSDLAVSGLRGAGLEALLLPGGGVGLGAALRNLSFRPRILTFLDVLEHVPPDEVAAALRDILDACRGFELVVVKVPVRGLLHGLARFVSRFGVHGPIRQLYQVGTWPPHLSYFSGRSMQTLLEGAGLAVTERIGDPDFEPGTLAGRIGADGRLLAAAIHGAGAGVASVIRATGRFDSAIFVARPAGVTGSPPGRPARESA